MADLDIPVAWPIIAVTEHENGQKRVGVDLGPGHVLQLTVTPWADAYTDIAVLAESIRADMAAILPPPEDLPR